MVDKETKALKIDTNDEVVKGTLVTQNGQVVHPSLTSLRTRNARWTTELPAKPPSSRPRRRSSPPASRAWPSRSPMPRPRAPIALPDGHMPFVALLTIFALACFVGYYVVWRVTPALHSPLMAVTNAVSSVIIVGALLAAGLKGLGAAQLFGGIAVVLAAVNIFGGFIVTHRMLSMFKKKPVKK